MLLNRPLKIILMSLLVSFSAMSRTDCDITQFKKYITAGSMEVFECDNFTELEEKDLGYGRRALHWVVLKRKLLSDIFLRSFFDRVTIWDVKDNNSHSPVTYFLTTYKASDVDEWMLDLLLAKARIIPLFSDAIEKTGSARLIKSSSEDFELKKTIYEKIWDDILSKKESFYDIQPNHYEVGLYKTLASIFSALINSDATYLERNTQRVTDYFFDRYYEQSPDSIKKFIIRRLFDRASWVDFKLEPKDRRYVLMLLQSEKIDISWPKTANEQQDYFSGIVDAVLSIDSVEGLELLIKKLSIPVRSLAVNDMFAYAISNNAERCFDYLVKNYRHIFFKKIPDQISYLHRAAYSEVADIFKRIVDMYVQQKLKDEAKTITVAGVTVMQVLSEKINDFPDDERYPEMLNYFVERIMRQP